MLDGISDLLPCAVCILLSLTTVACVESDAERSCGFEGHVGVPSVWYYACTNDSSVFCGGKCTETEGCIYFTQLSADECVMCISTFTWQFPYPTYNITPHTTAQGWLKKDCSFEECNYYTEDSYRTFTDSQLSLADHVGLNMDISLEFRTTSQQGLMLYFGMPTGIFFFSIYLDGSLKIHLHAGCLEIVIVVDQDFSDNSWHFLQVNKFGRWVSARVENTIASHGMYDPTDSGCTGWGSDGHVYVGGMGDGNSRHQCNYQTAGKCSKGFEGCLKNVKMGGNLVGVATEDVEILPCHGHCYV